MELIQAPIRRSTSHHQFNEIRIMFLGDFQWAGKKAHGTALGELQDTIASGLAQRCYFIGMGDYIDFASPSNRARLQSAQLYETSAQVIDDKALELTHEIFELALKPTIGRWLGLVEGHHFYQLSTGDTTDMRLCGWLKAPFLGTCGVIRTIFQRSKSSSITATIWVHHGHGNGQTGYYPLARLEKTYADQESVDVLAIGHTTKMGALAKNRVGYRWSSRQAGEAYHRKVYLIGTGGYSRSYIEGCREGRVPRDGYALKKMLGPSVIGSPTLILRPRREMIRGDRHVLDLRVEV